MAAPSHVLSCDEQSDVLHAEGARISWHVAAQDLELPKGDCVVSPGFRATCSKDGVSTGPFSLVFYPSGAQFSDSGKCALFLRGPNGATLRFRLFVGDDVYEERQAHTWTTGHGRGPASTFKWPVGGTTVGMEVCTEIASAEAAGAGELASEVQGGGRRPETVLDAEEGEAWEEDDTWEEDEDEEARWEEGDAPWDAEAWNHEEWDEAAWNEETWDGGAWNEGAWAQKAREEADEDHGDAWHEVVKEEEEALLDDDADYIEDDEQDVYHEEEDVVKNAGDRAVGCLPAPGSEAARNGESCKRRLQPDTNQSAKRLRVEVLALEQVMNRAFSDMSA